MKKVYIIGVNNSAHGPQLITITSRARRVFKDRKRYINTNTVYYTCNYDDALNIAREWSEELHGRVTA